MVSTQPFPPISTRPRDTHRLNNLQINVVSVRAEAGKRSSVISVTSAGGAQRSFSVVINEHHLCLHAHQFNDFQVGH